MRFGGIQMRLGAIPMRFGAIPIPKGAIDTACVVNPLHGDWYPKSCADRSAGSSSHSFHNFRRISQPRAAYKEGPLSSAIPCGSARAQFQFDQARRDDTAADDAMREVACKGRHLFRQRKRERVHVRELEWCRRR